jgi:TorA maturation chaperone TorD
VSATAVRLDPPAPAEAAALRAKADFYLCLARAFQPPALPDACEAFANALPQDLAELAAETCYDIARLARRFGAAALDARDELLADYSALFLVPPVPVPLNTGLYLDGALFGRGTSAMLERYRRAGLAPDERFRDLPDHVAMQLEYLAVLFGRAADGDVGFELHAREFLAQFVLEWLPPFRQALRAAAPRVPAARAYGVLAEMLEIAARHEISAASG